MLKPDTTGGTTRVGGDKEILGGPGSNGAQRDRELLRQPRDVEEQEELRLERIPR